METRLLMGLMSVCVLAAADGKTPSATLPLDWHGHWSGTLVIHGVGDQPSEVPMAIKIEPIKDSTDLTWVIVYGEGVKASVRDYKLVPDREKPGRFQIDENNGIVLDARLANGVMYSHFDVGGSFLTARYERRGETLRFEVISAKPAAQKTGDGKVQSYVVQAVQTAELKKK